MLTSMFDKGMDYDEKYATRDGRFVIARRGLSVAYIRDGETVAEYELATQDLASRKFMQLKRLIQRTGGDA